MDNFTELIRKYKKEIEPKIKNKIFREEIYKLLETTVKEKADYIYYHEWYPWNLYHKCKSCRVCTKLNNVPKSEYKIICEDCEICKCIKGCFNLYNNGLCEWKDVFNDIWFEINRIINNYDIIEDFNKYLFGSLWVYRPTFLTKKFLHITSKTVSQVIIFNDGVEKIKDIIDPNPNAIENLEKDEKSKIEKLAFAKLTYKEKKLVIYFIRKKLTAEEIAKKEEVSKRTIERRIKKIIEKLKYWVEHYYKVGITAITIVTTVLIVNQWITKLGRVNFPQKAVYLKYEEKKQPENKFIQWVKEFIKQFKKEPKETNNWQEKK